MLGTCWSYLWESWLTSGETCYRCCWLWFDGDGDLGTGLTSEDCCRLRQVSDVVLGICWNWLSRGCMLVLSNADDLDSRCCRLR